MVTSIIIILDKNIDINNKIKLKKNLQGMGYEIYRVRGY